MPDLLSPASLIAVDAGRLGYADALAWQQRLHAQVVKDGAEQYLLCVEHPPVLTLGKHADLRHLSLALADYQRLGVEVIRTDRGGEVTAHMPGQLVVYPILRLSSFRLSPKSYVALLEAAVIELLAGYGIAAATDPVHPGVWVGTEKVCAVGVRFKERATMHGLALNVVNDLTLFAQIVPCGIAGRGVTSVSRLLGREVSLAEARLGLAGGLTCLLRASAAATRRSSPLQWQEGLSTI